MLRREKRAARRLVAAQIARLGPEERAAKSEAIRRRVCDLPEVREASCVMGFLPLSDEVDTRPILEDLIRAGKRVYVPRTFVREGRIVPVRLLDLDRLRTGEYGIPEPDTEETCAPETLDVVLVPGRAFDRRGNRLGRGAGFYDRFMASNGFRALRCGVAFACQVLEQVPHDRTDLPVHLLVTEAETIRCG